MINVFNRLKSITSNITNGCYRPHRKHTHPVFSNLVQLSKRISPATEYAALFSAQHAVLPKMCSWNRFVQFICAIINNVDFVSNSTEVWLSFRITGQKRVWSRLCSSKSPFKMFREYRMTNNWLSGGRGEGGDRFLDYHELRPSAGQKTSGNWPRRNADSQTCSRQTKATMPMTTWTMKTTMTIPRNW